MAGERLQWQIDRLLDEAEQAIAVEDWPTVGSRARSVLVIDPANSDAAAYLAAAQRALGASIPPATNDPRTPTPPATTATASVQPTSFANGRYQVKLLGEGGKKKVCLAQDTLLDRQVALALIKTEGLDEAGRNRIRRGGPGHGPWVHTLTSHTVFDLGQEQDQPYMVTELMGGGDVEGLIEKAPDHRFPLEQAISIAQETCRGLEFAHSRGIVHRNLKPGNVWLTSEGVAGAGDRPPGGKSPSIE